MRLQLFLFAGLLVPIKAELQAFQDFNILFDDGVADTKQFYGKYINLTSISGVSLPEFATSSVSRESLKSPQFASVMGSFLWSSWEPMTSGNHSVLINEYIALVKVDAKAFRVGCSYINATVTTTRSNGFEGTPELTMRFSSRHSLTSDEYNLVALRLETMNAVDLFAFACAGKKETWENLRAPLSHSEAGNNGLTVNEIPSMKARPIFHDSKIVPQNSTVAPLTGVDVVTSVYPVKIGPYFEGRLLGKGGFGEVFEGFHEVTNERVAIKKMALSLDTADLIEREVEILRRIHLAPHPNVIKIHQIYLTPFAAYVVMNEPLGGDVYTYVENLERRRLPEVKARNIFVQLVHALHHVHHQNISHNDLKPQNMLLEFDSDFLKMTLIDFGLSTLTAPGEFLRQSAGTPGFSPPEVMYTRKPKYDPKKADAFTVGVILYWMLHGREMYDPRVVEDAEDIRREMRYVEFNSYLSAPVRKLITSLTKFAPGQRMTIDELINHPYVTGGIPDSALSSDEAEARYPYDRKVKKGKRGKKGRKVVEAFEPDLKIAGGDEWGLPLATADLLNQLKYEDLINWGLADQVVGEQPRFRGYVPPPADEGAQKPKGEHHQYKLAREFQAPKLVWDSYEQEFGM